MLAGFHEDWCSSVHGLINKNPVLARNELQLDRYDYEQIHPECPFCIIRSWMARPLTVFKNDPDRTAETIAQVSKQDAETFRRLVATPACRADLKNSSHHDRLCGCAAGLAQPLHAGGGAVGRASSTARTVPSSARDCRHFPCWGHMTGRPIPKGGSGMLTVALGRVIEAHGGIILTNMPVTGIYRRGRPVQGLGV